MKKVRKRNRPNLIWNSTWIFCWREINFTPTSGNGPFKGHYWNNSYQNLLASSFSFLSDWLFVHILPPLLRDAPQGHPLWPEIELIPIQKAEWEAELSGVVSGDSVPRTAHWEKRWVTEKKRSICGQQSKRFFSFVPRIFRSRGPGGGFRTVTMRKRVEAESEFLVEVRDSFRGRKKSPKGHFL